jgi:hypothetical protein
MAIFMFMFCIDTCFSYAKRGVQAGWPALFRGQRPRHATRQEISMMRDWPSKVETLSSQADFGRFDVPVRAVRAAFA